MSKNHKRPIRSSQLMIDLVLSGRSVKCEICGCMDMEKLDLHHVVPVAVRPIHSMTNIVVLCKSHHALVERYYWEQRSRLMPIEAKELRNIAQEFRARAVPLKFIKDMQSKTKDLWLALNSHRKCSNISWWQQTYHEAKRWANDQVVIREVMPKDAITEDSWFVQREGFHS